MNLKNARSILADVKGRDFPYLQLYGLSLIHEMMTTIRNRLHVTTDELLAADAIEFIIQRNRKQPKWLD